MDHRAQTSDDQALTPSATPEQQFLRLMSHEMRTPLNGVIGMLGLLRQTSLDGAQTAYAEAAQKSAEHLLGLVNDLLDYARLEAGALEFYPTPVDVENLVREVAELLSPRAHDKGLEIVWAVTPNLPMILADEGRLRQVLFNLAGNAVKFTENGGVFLRVEMEQTRSDQVDLTWVVEDTGPGVPAEARQRIFEEFGHADASDAARYDGAGLGLAVVRRLAEAMGGVVTVGDRAEGPGARFCFRAEFTLQTPIPASTDVVPPLKGQSVALHSSNDLVRQAVGLQLRASGADLSDQAPVVLVDHALTKGSDEQGLMACPSQPAIILLKPSERDLIAPYRQAGFHAYLIKPLRRASLIERVLSAAGQLSASMTEAPHPEDERGLPVVSTGVRVLLVEDNPVNALLARTLLQREGCLVQTAANGHEALDVLSRNRFDLVLMDMRMPGLDGPSATRILRARGDQTPIVALTANVFAEDRQRCFEVGMTDHLTKPLSLEGLRTVLARWTKAGKQVKVVTD